MAIVSLTISATEGFVVAMAAVVVNFLEIPFVDMGSDDMDPMATAIVFITVVEIFRLVVVEVVVVVVDLNVFVVWNRGVAAAPELPVAEMFSVVVAAVDSIVVVVLKVVGVIVCAFIVEVE